MGIPSSPKLPVFRINIFNPKSSFELEAYFVQQIFG